MFKSKINFHIHLIYNTLKLYYNNFDTNFQIDIYYF